MITKKHTLFLVIFAVMITGVTFQTYIVFQISLSLISLVHFIKYKTFDKLFTIILSLILCISIGQAIIFNSFTFYNFIGVFIIFLTPYFVFRLVRLNFFKYYVHVIYVLAFISIICWSLQNISSGFTEILASISRVLKLDPKSNESVIIFNIEYGRSALGFLKNAGFTAEGGLFCTFLIPALYLNNINGFKLFDKRNIVFIIAIITTSSTAGYAALMFFILYAVISIKHKIIIILTIPLVIYSLFILVNDLPFMFDKVNKSYTDEMNVYNTTDNPTRKGRFLSARIDLDMIAKYPLTGKGIYNDIRYLNAEEKEIGYSNSYLGIVGLASRYGLILWFFYMFFLLKFLFKYHKLMNTDKNNHNKFYPIFFFASILSIAIGQNPFYLSVYLIMVYAGYYLSNKKVSVHLVKNKNPTR